MSKLIGIVGGSAAGKTLLAKEVARLLGPDATILSQDNYYSDIGPLTSEERLKVNFDCPEAFDQALFVADLQRLRVGQPIRIPAYDFATCHRTSHSEPKTPPRYVLIEGLFLLTVPEIRDLLDHAFFVDCPEDVRIQRILHRDLTERGRTHDAAWANIHNCVLPMHQRYIESFKKFAELTVMNDRDEPDAIRRAAETILAHLWV
jgi:uridine kinase